MAINNLPINNIDIIIPVYNALDDVQHCITSVLANKAGFNPQLILVNDKSNEETSQYLRDIDSQESCITLIEHEANTGYSGAANTGFTASSAAYVIMLNSDTIVSKYWLQGLITCAESDPKIGVVSPMTNSGIWQSIPFIPNSTTESTINFPLHEEVDNFASLLKQCSHSHYPELPYIHGFCQFIKREVIDAIGIVDIESFPSGMGSELDYCFRASDAGYLSVVADDTFIYHSKAKSLTEASREISDWQTRFYNKHGEERYKESAVVVSNHPVLNSLRISTAFEVYRTQISTSISPFNYNIGILIDSFEQNECLDTFFPLARAMSSLGVNLQILLNTQDFDKFFKKYNHFPIIKEIVIGYENEEHLQNHLQYYDVIISSEAETLKHLKMAQDNHPEILPVYYVNEVSVKEDVKNITKPSDFDSILLLSKSDLIAKDAVSNFGKPAYSLNTLYQECRLSLTFEKIILFFNSSNLIQANRHSKLLLRLFKDALLYHRKLMNPVAFSKGILPRKGFLSLDPYFDQLAKPLWQRRLNKFLKNPHAYFADSHNALLRPLRILFKKV